MKPIILCFKILFLNLICALHFTVIGQNIYDYSHSLRYARYLFSCEDYALAGQEYFKAYKLDPSNSQILDSAFYALMKSEQYSSIIDISEAVPDTALVRSREHVIYSALYQNDFRFANLQINKLKSEQAAAANKWLLSSMILQSPSASIIIDEEMQQDTICVKIRDLLEKFNHKPPVRRFLYILSSIFLPGSGHALAGELNSGIKIFFMIGINSFQAYKTVSEHPDFLLYPAVFATVAAGFYAGQIYGAGKLAKMKKQNRKEELKTEVLNILKTIN